MPRRKSRPFTAVVRGKKRDMVWVPWQSPEITVTFENLIVLEADMLLNFFGNTGAEIAVGTTIMRIRGSYKVSAAINVQSVQWAAVAILVREDGTFAELLESEMLHPLWRDDRNEQFLSEETAAGTFTNEDRSYVIDSKARRIIRETGQRLELAMRTSISTSSSTVAVATSGVVLLMLP